MIVMAFQSAYGNATGPDASDVLASITVPAPGYYEVVVAGYIDGKATSADEDNIKLQSDPETADTYADVAVVLLTWTPAFQRAVVYAQSTICVVAIADGGDDAVYHVNLSAENLYANADPIVDV